MHTYRSGRLRLLAGDDIHRVPVRDSRLLQLQLRLQEISFEQNRLVSVGGGEDVKEAGAGGGGGGARHVGNKSHAGKLVNPTGTHLYYRRS